MWAPFLVCFFLQSFGFLFKWQSDGSVSVFIDNIDTWRNRIEASFDSIVPTIDLAVAVDQWLNVLTSSIVSAALPHGYDSTNKENGDDDDDDNDDDDDDDDDDVFRCDDVSL
jgi:hypothetical protein